MDIYKKMYLRLFNAVTDAVKELAENDKIKDLLCNAQKDCGELFMEYGENDIYSEKQP